MKLKLSYCMMLLMLLTFSFSCSKQQKVVRKSTNKKRILIEKLARDYRKVSKEEINASYKAYDELLKSKNRKTIVSLSKYFDDSRTAISMRAVSHSTLGDTCFEIIEMILFNFPKGYAYGYNRRGKDGKSHQNPYYSHEKLFTKDNFPQWLNARKDKSLLDMQIEVLEYVINAEKKIGFRSIADKNNYLKLLENHLQKLQLKLNVKSQ